MPPSRPCTNCVRREWRLLSETHNPPAGRNGSPPPQPRRTPRTPATCFTAKQISAQRRKLQKLSDEQQRKVQKGREALQRFCATKDAKDRGAPGVAAHRFRATLEGRDNITGRFVAPVEIQDMCPPDVRCDALEPLRSSRLSREPSHSRCGGANFDGNLGRPASTRPDSACA